jgi:xanthine permease XanP
MAKKAANLIYGLDDKPPLTVAALLGLQHVFVLTSGWVLVVVIVTTVGGTQEQVAYVLRMSMIASGVATILQSLPNSPVGSGYFCPIGSGPAYVSASILAGRIGGLSAVFTMTTLAGIFEGLLARIVPRLRPLFPPEVTGLVVTMVGVELVAVACPRFLGFQDGGTGPQGIVTAVATATLAAMIGPTVWSKGSSGYIQCLWVSSWGICSPISVECSRPHDCARYSTLRCSACPGRRTRAGPWMSRCCPHS